MLRAARACARARGLLDFDSVANLSGEQVDLRLAAAGHRRGNDLSLLMATRLLSKGTALRGDELATLALRVKVGDTAAATATLAKIQGVGPAVHPHVLRAGKTSSHGT